MTDKEAMKLALFALDIVKIHYTQSRHVNEAIAALKERLADPMREVQRLGQEIEQEPVSKLQEPTAERAWFTIDELNAWADKKLAENPNWVMPKDEPERDEPPPQRTWVGLTDEDKHEIELRAGITEDDDGYIVSQVFKLTEAKLKEKNT
jgi:hypothetical protein